MATQVGEHGQVVVAVRRDQLLRYITDLQGVQWLDGLGCGIRLVDRALDNPDSVLEAHLRDLPPDERRLIRGVQRWRRHLSFRDRVLAAYDRRCAMCPFCRDGIEAVPIVPDADRRSVPTSHGLALCERHRRAYDAGLVAVADDYRLLVNRSRLAGLAGEQFDAGLAALGSGLRHTMWLPPEKMLRPSPDLLALGSAIRGWEI